jgi:hypothetical protein
MDSEETLNTSDQNAANKLAGGHSLALHHVERNGVNGHAQRHTPVARPSILNLDILLLVLDKLLDRHQQRYAKSNELISVDRKVNLSQESFNISTEPPDFEAIENFRLVCKEFNRVGAQYQFSRVTTRVSKHGLDRLENIAKSPLIANCVLKFGYMVPLLFEPGMLTLR